MWPFILTGIIVLGVLIFIHELGHFLAAKLFRVGVEKFSLGFGPKLLGKRVGETEYLLSAVPLGGYVKLVGEDPRELVMDREKDFSARPVGTRMKIILAGPLFNLIFALFIFSGVYMVGMPVYTEQPLVGEVEPGSPAMRAGLKPADRIVAINHQPVKGWEELAQLIHAHPNREIILEIERGGERLSLSVVPEPKKVLDNSGKEITVGLIGIKPQLQIERYNPLMAIIRGFMETLSIVELTIVSIIKIILKEIPATTIGGPILIFQIAGEVFRLGLITLARFTALISINLAILNLLPIPILDGGHMIFLTIEKLRGQPVSIRGREIAQHIGMAVIIGIMLLAFYNDIMRIFER